MESLKEASGGIGQLINKLDEKDKEIILFLKKYPMVTTKTIAEHLSMDKTDVAARIKKIKEIGLVRSRV